MISMSLCTVFSRLFNLLDIYAVFPFLNILYWTYIWNKPYAEIKYIKKNVRTVWNFLSFKTNDTYY